MKFSEWIENELNQRGWSRSEAARRGDISPSMFDKVINGHAKPGLRFIEGIAKGFGISPLTVFRAAYMPSKSEDEHADELIEKIKDIVEGLPPEEQKNVYEYTRMLRRLSEDKARYEPNHKRKPRPATG